MTASNFIIAANTKRSLLEMFWNTRLNESDSWRSIEICVNWMGPHMRSAFLLFYCSSSLIKMQTSKHSNKVKFSIVKYSLNHYNQERERERKRLLKGWCSGTHLNGCCLFFWCIQLCASKQWNLPRTNFFYEFTRACIHEIRFDQESLATPKCDKTPPKYVERAHKSKQIQ